MKNLIFALLLATAISAMAQNGGQYPENNSVKLEWSGTNVKITNKQSCSSVIRVSYSNVTTDITIAGNSFYVQTLPSGTANVKAKNTTNCGNSDYGLVELTLIATPLKFLSYDFTAKGSYDVLSQFETTETVNVSHYNILASKDGVNYTTVGVILADPDHPNRAYSMKVNCASLNKQ